MKYLCFLFLICFALSPAAAELRSLEEIFPALGEERSAVFSEDGFLRSLEKNERPGLVPSASSGIDLLSEVLKTNPSYLAESLLVIPYKQKTLDNLDAYNALGRIRDLKGRLYRSHTRNAEVPLFEDATRISGENSTRTIPDPPPSRVLPDSETVYIRLKDINFGNSFYRGDISISPHGVSYHLTNTKNLSYLIFTVMKEGKFSAALYMEPLSEGMLIYSIAGADASDFIASKVDIPSAISKRLAVFISWIKAGLEF